MANQILSVECKSEQISSGLVAIYSSDFQDKLINILNPYSDGETAKRIADILQSGDISIISKLKKIC